MRLWLLLAVGLLSAPPLPAQLRGFDAWVERARRAWEIPGLAVAVVKGRRATSPHPIHR